MPAPILYYGDTHLRNAAAYLAGVLTAGGLEFDYRPSDHTLTGDDLLDPRALVILSDYPAARVAPGLQHRLVELVSDGCGLLMIGGWESFHGLGGDWDGTAIAKVLPVEVGPEDDRLNSDQPLVVRRTGSHAITDTLPWEQRPPAVGGMNRVKVRSTGHVLLEADRLHLEQVDRAGEDRRQWIGHIEETLPLLVVGQHGAGRTAALMTDVAPHWVGGLVDWGDGRVAAQAAGADPVEVGNLYAQFVQQLVSWTLRVN